eukprot:1147795_1
MRGNYFIGIAPSSTSWFTRSIASLPNKCRIHDPLDLHITVAFLGKISSPNIIESLKSYIDDIPTFAIPQHYNLLEPHAFPHLSRMTSIGYKVGTNYDLIKDFMFIHRPQFYELASVQKRDARVPQPHITIARPPRDDVDLSEMDYIKRKMTEWVENKNGNHAPIEHELLFHEIALYSWSDTYPRAPLFTKLHTKSLIPSNMEYQDMTQSK